MLREDDGVLMVQCTVRCFPVAPCSLAAGFCCTVPENRQCLEAWLGQEWLAISPDYLSKLEFFFPSALILRHPVCLQCADCPWVPKGMLGSQTAGLFSPPLPSSPFVLGENVVTSFAFITEDILPCL